MIKIGDKQVQKIMVGNKEVQKIIMGNNAGTGDIVYQKGGPSWTSVALYGPIASSQTFVNGFVYCAIASNSPYAYRLNITTSSSNSSSPFTTSDTLSDILLKWYNYENSTNYTQIRNITITPMIYNNTTSTQTFSSIAARLSSDSSMSTYTEYNASDSLTLPSNTFNLVPGVTIDPNSFTLSLSNKIWRSRYLAIYANSGFWATYQPRVGGYAFQFEVA